MLLDLSLQGCRINGVSTGSCGRVCVGNSGFPTNRNPKVKLAAVRWVKNDEFAVSFRSLPPPLRRAWHRWFSYFMRRSNSKRA